MTEVKCPICGSNQIYKECTSKFTEYVNTGDTFTHEVTDDGILRCSKCNCIFEEVK